MKLNQLIKIIIEGLQGTKSRLSGGVLMQYLNKKRILSRNKIKYNK